MTMRVSVLAVGLVACAGSSACQTEPSLTTTTRSESLPTAGARVAFLGRYLLPRSPVLDAAFVIDYHDNSGLVPGPSDWTILAGLQLPHGALTSWLEDTRPCEEGAPVDVGGLDAILPAAWKVASPARCLRRGSNTLLVHDPEDVLVFFSATR
jgi:hypothetical protein